LRAIIFIGCESWPGDANASRRLFLAPSECLRAIFKFVANNLILYYISINMNIDLQNLKPSTAMTIVGAVSPVFLVLLFIFMQDKALFLSMDVIKLCALSTAISLGPLICNFYYALIPAGIGKFDDETQEQFDERINRSAILLSGLYTSSIFSLLCLIRFYSNFKVEFYISCLCGIELLMLSFAIVFDMRRTNREFRKMKKRKANNINKNKI
jgi:hypothetical protein